MFQGCAANSKEWENWEDKIIRDNYGKTSYSEMEKLLPGRTNQSIQHRRRKLNIKTKNKKNVAIEKWSDQETGFLMSNYGTLSFSELSKQLGKSIASVNQKVKRLVKDQLLVRVIGPSEPWSTQEDLCIITHYASTSVAELCNLLPNRTAKSIIHRKKTLNLDFDKRKLNRKYNINMNYFSIPTIENSYWAGFIAADGCLSPKKHLVSFGQKAEDGYLLEQLTKDCGFTGEVRYFTTKDDYEVASLFIWGVEQWFTDLKKNFNITPQKSLTLKPPKIIDEENIIAFIRGYIDGDGGIYPTNGPNTWTINITGTYEMLWWISNYFLSIISEIKARPYKHKNIWAYSPSGERAIKILKKLLEIETPYLIRKWQPVIDYWGSPK